MANLIDILINAKWLGGGSVTAAEGDLRGMGNAATATSIEMAAASQKSQLLGARLSELGKEVAEGKLTVDQATAAYQKYGATLADVKTQAPQAGASLGGLATKVFAVTAALTAATISAKKFFGAIKEGADLKLTITRFDRLAKSIGTTGDALRQDLGIASLGLVSDLELMASATDFLALGLAKTHDEAVRLSSVAAQLGFNMNQLVLTLTNRTTMRFDALGVSVDGFTERVKELEEAGYDVNEAFTEAFLLQAEEQIERVGSKAETSAGKIDILTASFEDSTTAAKQWISEVAGPFVDYLVSGTVAANAAEKAFQDFGAAGDDIVLQAKAVQDLNQALRDISKQPGYGADSLARLERGKEIMLDTITVLAMTGNSYEEQRTILESFGFEVDDNRIKLGQYRITWEELNNAIDQFRIEAAIDRVNQFREATTVAAEKTAAYIEEMAKLQEQVEAIEFNKMLDTLEMTNDEFVELAYKVGGADKAIELLENRVKAATAANRDYGSSISGIVSSLLDFTASALEQMAPLLEERANLFQDFQLDLSDISQSEGQNREETEAQYEERRTGIVEKYGARRAQSEEDYQRRQVRNAAKLAGDIEDAQEDSYERQAEIRENANQRFADLERDHADRISDIIRDADDDLTEAAGRLDASAIASITRRRERALEDEEEAYQQSHEAIQQTLDQQLSAEQVASAARIADMQEYFDERQVLDEEDHQLRLARLEDANSDQLAVLDEKHKQELIEIQNAASLAQGLREIAYIQERTALGDHLGDKAKQEAQLQKELLLAEEKWWKERTALIPDTSGPGAASLPEQFFGGAGPTISGNTFAFYINGADDPEATAVTARDELLALFRSFT